MTKLRLLLLYPLLAWAAVSLAVAAHADSFDPKTMMDVSEIQRGAHAIGKTVFAGTSICDFRLEIIDIMAKSNAGSDMILARVTDGPVVARQSGIIGGMSGSPVYIDGRLIGAVAWGWSFQREPITGITPIRSMLKAMDMMDSPKLGASPAPQKWIAQRPLTLGGTRFTSAEVLSPGQKPAPGVLPLYPVSTPINCNGMGPRTLKFAQDKLGRFGLSAEGGGGGPSCIPAPVDLVPGSAVGVRFMEGDFDMTGIGTVTYRKDDKILAFGHPLMQLGYVDLPLSTAWINDFLPSYEHSNKMGAGLNDIGTLKADMPWAIGGQVGPKAPLIPAHIQIVDKTHGRTRDFNVKVFRQPALTASVLAMAISSSFEASYNPGREGTIRTHFEIKGDGGAHLTRDNQFYMPSSPDKVAMGEVQEIMGLLEDNRWQPQNVSELNYRAEIEEKDETAVVERVYAEENVAKAGKPLHVHVLLRPDAAPLEEQVFTLNMPLDLPKGSLRIGIGGGQDAMYFRGRLGLVIPNFDNLTSLLDYYQNLEQNKQLCVMAALPGKGMTIGSTQLMHLPASISAVLEKSSRSDVEQAKDEVIVSRELPYVVFGREVLSLATEDREGAKGAPAPATTPATKPPADPSPKAASDEFAAAPESESLWWAASAFKPGARPRVQTDATEEEPLPVASDRPAKPTKAEAGADKETPDKTAESDKAPGKEAKGPKDKDEEPSPDKPVVRQPETWVQSKNTDFATGQTKGTAISAEGAVIAAPVAEKVATLAELQVWGMLATDRGTYIGTGAPGRVYKLSGNTPQLLFDCQAFGVRALTSDPSGNVYAGAWPGGTIYKITPDGQGSVFTKLACEYVWALAWDAQGRLLAGTGPSGQLYQIDGAGKASELTQLPQQHILSVLPTKDGLYLGTAGKGLVYKLQPEHQSLVCLDADDDDITALTVDAGGRVCASTDGGKVYRLEDGQSPKVLFDDSDQPVYALALCGGKLYAGTGTDGKLLALDHNGVYQTIDQTDATHVLCLATGPDQTLFGGTGNAGKIIKLTPAAAVDGTFTSSVFDAKRAAKWGSITGQTVVPSGTELALLTRSGNSSNPDDGSWSAWASPYGQPGTQQINSPAARYLQYRVQMKKAASGATPVLRRIAVSYLTANQAPSVDLSGFDPDKALHAKAEIKWDAADPDKDDLLATVEYRAVNTDDWKLVKELDASEGTCEWDTSGVTDGLYDVRVTVTDEIANPGTGLSDQQIAYNVRLDNTKPELTVQKTEIRDGKLVIEGMASDATRVAEVAYQVGDQWRGALPLDGAFDGQYEQFRVTVPLKDGEATVDLRVQDTAGNVATTTVTWPLDKPDEKPKEKPKDEGKPRK